MFVSGNRTDSAEPADGGHTADVMVVHGIFGDSQSVAARRVLNLALLQ